MNRFLPLTIISVGILICLGTLHGQMPAERALRNMKTAEGLEVSLFAAEPDLVNPTAMDVDSEGRVWVTEAANYRLFKNPLSRREGDRIRILEDTNGDGRCDKATTYYQDASLQAPLGIAVLGRRVYVCQSPDLFYLEDTDGDGVADKKTVVLTGFKGVDHDHAIHGVIFGPDGHLYLSNGDQGLDVTDHQGNRIRVGPDAPHMAASVLRTDLEGKSLELLAEGLRNPFEPAVDSLGNVFISDNDDDGNEQCRIVFVMEGGNYGYWPRRRGDRRLDAVHWNEDAPGVVPKILKTGFGSPTGMMFYEGTLLPEPFRRTLIHADAGPGVVRSYPVRPSGASFSAEIQTILSCPGDKWFRPIDVAAAPDGSLFVADWYDPGVGGHNLRDFSRGRVYRVAPTGSRYQVQKPDLSSATAAVTALGSPNQATRFLAFQALDEKKSDQARQILEPLARKGDDVVRARALWLAGSWGEPGRALALETTRDPRPEFRIQALRILAAPGAESLRAAHWLLEDSDPGVRRELLLRLQHSKAEWASDWILKLAERFDGQDRFYREALGIAMRGHESRYFSEIVKKFGNGWDKRFVELAFQLHSPEAVQMAGEVLADQGRPVEERLDALKIVAAGQSDMAVDRMLGQLREDTPRPIILAALQFLGRDAGSGGASARPDPRLRDFLKTALQNAELRSGAERLIRELRLTEFIPQLMETAKNRQNSRESRIAAIETMRQLQSPLPLDPLRLLLGDPDRNVAIAAARAISALANDDAQQTLQGLLLKPSVPGDLRREIVRLLGASKSGALLLLQMAEQGKLAQDLVLEASTVTNTSPHENIRLMAQQQLPLPKTRTGKPLAPLPVLIQMKGDVPRGKTIFHSTDGPQCYRCHKIAGEGRDVGPDLSRIGGKLAREGLLESILNPSAAVGHEYQVWLVRTKSQGYVDGYIRSETQEAMELVDSNGNTIRIQASDIVSRTKSATSLMPTGLSSGMTTQQLVDLVAYLSTLK
jgi:putative membrane-bound dehydrogenase-like protein